MTLRKLGHGLARLSLAASTLVAAAVLAQAPATATAAWPNQPIKIIVPFPAGGASDQIGRLIGKAIGDELKVPVVVENRSGANGSVGATLVAKAARRLHAAGCEHRCLRNQHRSLQQPELRPAEGFRAGLGARVHAQHPGGAGQFAFQDRARTG